MVAARRFNFTQRYLLPNGASAKTRGLLVLELVNLGACSGASTEGECLHRIGKRSFERQIDRRSLV
jgi:hypothetical protein